ncbi:hypothetical protein DPMN_056797 [Dreissena polymorpha]|uniref:Uncharacterized protein n=3 Tax=Dreissena polymorpha TaxID=45954 RepID=A0A9D4CU42_DREPO|nr:hypothetical protein DPMN_056797 [Dreissena polymorpha]
MIMLRCRLSHQSSRSSIDTSETSPTGKSGSKFSFNLVLNQNNAYTIKSSEKERTMALRQSMINKISRTDSSRF